VCGALAASCCTAVRGGAATLQVGGPAARRELATGWVAGNVQRAHLAGAVVGHLPAPLGAEQRVGWVRGVKAQVVLRAARAQRVHGRVLQQDDGVPHIALPAAQLLQPLLLPGPGLRAPGLWGRTR
jgi:hypothetical protein